nr:unnamed protein product [Digitaria exilis]
MAVAVVSPRLSPTFAAALAAAWVLAAAGWAAAGDPPLSPKGLNYEVAALVAVKSRLRDEKGVMAQWDITSVDPCTWSMVACSPDKFVISLQMANNGLSGTLSPSIGNLSHLQTLRLDRNNLSGLIPLDVAKLPGLTFLDLSFNNLSGPVPKIYAHDYRNLLRLYGFCMTSKERLLVYPYMPNGSVADRLRDYRNGKPSLDWSKRMRIALGAARGLLYLHEQCNPKIIHRDVKAANILLDESFEAIVGDFGLAKLLDRQESHVTTAVRGTIGHIAPEYLSTGQSSEKTDVYGFGILLLELITGPKTLSNGHAQSQKGMILDWVRELKEEKKLDKLVDRDLKDSFDVAELECSVDVIIQCTQTNPILRPKMSEVLHALEANVTLSESSVELHREPVPYGGTYSFSIRHEDPHDSSSFIIEPIELSGPR